MDSFFKHSFSERKLVVGFKVNTTYKIFKHGFRCLKKDPFVI